LLNFYIEKAGVGHLISMIHKVADKPLYSIPTLPAEIID